MEVTVGECTKAARESVSRIVSILALLTAAYGVLVAGQGAAGGAPPITGTAAPAPGPSAALLGPATGVTATAPGATWARLHGFPAGLKQNSLDIACASTVDCVALAGGGGGPSRLLATSNGGMSWTVSTMPGIGFVSSLSCAPGTEICWALGGYPSADAGFADESTDGGLQWGSVSIPSDVRSLGSVSCPTATECVATGTGPFPGMPAFNSGEIVETTDGGTTWTETEPGGFFGTVVCPDASVCMVTGSSEPPSFPIPQDLPAVILGTTDGGISWTQEYKTADPAGAYFDSLACPSTLDCYAGGQLSYDPSSTPGPPVLLATKNGGATWTAQSLPSTTPPPGESQDGAQVGPCSTPTTCWGWDYSPMYTSDGGATWSKSPGVVLPGGVSAGPQVCPSSTVCYGVTSSRPRPAGPIYLAVASTFDAQGSGCGGTLSGDAAGIAEEPGGGGYWLASAAGAVAACGTATYYGSAPASSSPIVAIAGAPGGDGYYLLARDGTVYPFGPGAIHRSASVPSGSGPFVGMAVDDASGGYWLVADDGGVFSFDAPYKGSLPGVGVHVDDVTGIAAPASGSGYWLVGRDGGVFAFGVPFGGSLPAIGVRVDDVIGILDAGIGAGYDLIGADGGAFAFGAGVPFCGSAAGVTSAPVVSASSYEWNGGYWLLGRDGSLYDLGVPDDGGAWSSPRPIASCT
jgi:photosystem II stability/assembly factor-like uncharacterized protein